MAEDISYAAYDICRTIVVPTDCTGIVDPTNPAFAYCSISNLKLTELFREGTTITDESGQTGEPCHEVETDPVRTGWENEITTCATEMPKFWALQGWAQEIIDPETGACLGWEPTEQDVSKCPSCSVENATCPHKMGLITLHNAWCGKKRHPDIAYVALIQRCLRFKTNGLVIERGQGFKPRTFTATSETNANFADPWGIDPRGAGVTTPWSEMYVTYEQAAELEALGVLACSCPSCSKDAEVSPLLRAAA